MQATAADSLQAPFTAGGAAAEENPFAALFADAGAAAAGEGTAQCDTTRRAVSSGWEVGRVVANSHTPPAKPGGHAGGARATPSPQARSWNHRPP